MTSLFQMLLEDLTKDKQECDELLRLAQVCHQRQRHHHHHSQAADEALSAMEPVAARLVRDEAPNLQLVDEMR